MSASVIDLKSLDRSDLSRLYTQMGDDRGLHFVERVEEYLGVEVVVRKLVGAGYSFKMGDHSVVVVNAEPFWFRQNFTIAHEIGHLSSGSECRGDTKNVNESERNANSFAAEMLLPKRVMCSINWGSVSLETIADNVWSWGVSTQALCYRLDNLRIPVPEGVLLELKRSTCEYLSIYWKNSNADELIAGRCRTSEALRFPESLIQSVRIAVASGRAPVESLSYVLNISVDELGYSHTELTSNLFGDGKCGKTDRLMPPDPFEWL
ncbi:ImmA/IrrE family metallo-endopeptidase [Actinomyces viscosus]|uniref:ImmA/IrrE family metallo-endopeptidase n=1 Tax=Actinomyces viscosus TaxID=1656 RepID=UPI0028F146F4|nr:ImmA/IrrE family metallo-endopeptidase [Actinomyces viscosus]